MQSLQTATVPLSQHIAAALKDLYSQWGCTAIHCHMEHHSSPSGIAKYVLTKTVGPKDGSQHAQNFKSHQYAQLQQNVAERKKLQGCGSTYMTHSKSEKNT